MEHGIQKTKCHCTRQFQVPQHSSWFPLPPCCSPQAGGTCGRCWAIPVIYLLIGPVFGVFMMRSASIQNFIYLAGSWHWIKIDAAFGLRRLRLWQKNGNWKIGWSSERLVFIRERKKVLDNVSFKVNKGRNCCLGRSFGGGKLTVARLAARFYDVDEGEIFSRRL